METIIGLIIFVGIFAAGLLIPIFIFRMIMKWLTGYDVFKSGIMSIPGHATGKKFVDFDQRKNWFEGSDYSGRKDKRKGKSDTPHYDRLHAMDMAEQERTAADRLRENAVPDTDAAPVPLSELIEQQKNQKSKEIESFSPSISCGEISTAQQ